MSEEPLDHTIWIETMVASRTGDPFVVIRWHDHSGELTPHEARLYAFQLFAAAAAAECDAFLVDFVCSRIGMEKESAVRMLQEFRRYRDEREDDPDA
jgi:hypothetical protein